MENMASIMSRKLKGRETLDQRDESKGSRALMVLERNCWV